MNIRKMTVCSLCIALACILSMIKLYQFPFGGSVTLLSMLVITLPAWIYGPNTGILSGLLYGMLQFVLGPTVISIPQVLLDYVLAFSVMGIAGFVSNRKNSLVKGYALAVIGRWIIATLAGLAWVAAGTTIWEGWNPLPYSMVYNGAYIGAEAVLTLVVISMPPMKKALEHVKNSAINN
ncbi:MAG: energy-coupled thiamine transporter ThiT [Clostridiales bacterium]|nr:energy-coupled thiamine transporter ThiT [Candidatus Crickella equi]